MTPVPVDRLPFPTDPGVVGWRRIPVDADTVRAGRAGLTGDERRRADGIVHPGARARFETARGALRTWLAALTGIPAADLPIRTGPHGKPALDPSVPGDWTFNVAHAGDRVLVALSRGRPVGIDLEPIRPAADLLPVARRWFAPAEAAALEGCSGPDLDRRFFRLWTRKEAWLKARGTGIAGGLARHPVDASPDGGIRRLTAPDGSGWGLVDLPLGDGWAAALAAGGTDWRPVGCPVELAPPPPPPRIPAP